MSAQLLHNEVAEVGRTLFDFACDSTAGTPGGFERVLCYEVADATRVAEALEQEEPLSPIALSSLQRLREVSFQEEDAPEVVPLDAVYAGLGGHWVLVEPVLAGRRALLCCYGGGASRLQVLQEVVLRAAAEMIANAESMAAAKLFRLSVALLECSLQDFSQPTVVDLLRAQHVDISVDRRTGVMQPLKVEGLANISDALARRSRMSADRHYIVQLVAEHANDVGALTLVFIASPEDSHNFQIPGAAQSHLACLRQLRSVMAFQ
ncbi:unnamed protein product, partial [Polarella glacialis]